MKASENCDSENSDNVDENIYMEQKKMELERRPGQTTGDLTQAIFPCLQVQEIIAIDMKSLHPDVMLLGWQKLLMTS